MKRICTFIFIVLIGLFSGFKVKCQNYLGYYKSFAPKVLERHYKRMGVTYEITATDSTLLFSVKDTTKPSNLLLHFSNNRCDEVMLSTLCTPCIEFCFNNLKNYKNGKDWKKMSETKLFSKKAKIVAEVFSPVQACPYLLIYKYRGTRKQFKAELKKGG